MPPTSVIELRWDEPTDDDIKAARELIDAVHYQGRAADGECVVAFANTKEAIALSPDFVPRSIRGDLCLVGAAIVKRGISYSKPNGRKDLVDQKFASLKIDKLSRGEVVTRLGLALISRVAVEPMLQRMDIGRRLAVECRRRAPDFVQGSQYVEVMTSQRLQDAQRLQKTGAKSDFLQAAGFRLAPQFTKIYPPRRDGRNRRLYYWAEVLR